MTTTPADAADYEWPHPPTLADRQRRYLEVRQHTLSTAALPPFEAITRQSDYVFGEASELWDAVFELTPGCLADPLSAGDELREIRHEIADVVLATTTLASYLGVTVEACIAEKTEADRGRG